ncbi:tetratricopeptide repeat-containing serine protease family protein [Streptomyces sp. NPDC048629]|uniref:tetratricopeptide repeat-containing serine protease family protein n=1 Tax=Streptomyces sp. NPDC048629 TaxID=3154824 RepID=UPI003447238C
MEMDRAVQVRAHLGDGPAGFGSGYLVAPRLVLTAAHVVPRGTEITVTLPGPGLVADAAAEPRPWRAAVRWRREDEAADAALVEVTDDDWRPPPSFAGNPNRRVQRWGLLVTAAVEQPVSCLGFPRMGRTVPEPGGPPRRAAEQLAARINPLTGGGAHRYELLSTHSPYGSEGDATGSPWSGMSGAAVFRDHLLVGVVRHDRHARTGARLTATRARALVADPGFRALVARHSSVAPELEAAELAGLLDPAPPERDLRSPLMLLRADTEAVAFRGRAEVCEELMAWCEQDPEILSVRALVGPAGQGKTRLSRWLTAALRARGWAAGQLRSDLAAGGPGAEPDLRPLAALQVDALVVVDYAEMQPRLVRQLIAEARRAGRRFRILLLARSEGTWKTAALGASGVVHDILSTAPVVRLHALDATVEARDEAFALAAADLAPLLGHVPGHGDVDWQALAREVRPATRRRRAAFEAALTVQMSALTALLQLGPRPLADDLDTLQDGLLRHEERYWENTAESVGLGPRDLPVLRTAVATAGLLGAADRAEALRTVARIPGVGARLHAPLADWLHELYPSSHGRYWGLLQPDRVAEFQASKEVIADPALLPSLFREATDDQLVQALTVLTRSVVAHANADRPDEAGIVLARLHRALDTVPLSAAVLRRTSAALPETSHVLARFAARIAADLLAVYEQERTAGNTDITEADLAWAHHNLARRTLSLRRDREALERAGTAVRMREQLAAADPSAHEADLAASLALQASCLDFLDRSEEAREPVLRALAIHRRLAAADPERQRPALVRSLIDTAIVLWHTDERQESDAHTQEALRLSRQLERERPGPHRSLLAEALRDSSVLFWNDGEYEQAVEAVEEAVSLWRHLAAANRDANASKLAGALVLLSSNYRRSERLEEATALCGEAVAIRRRRAHDLPSVYAEKLALDLFRLGQIHYYATRQEEAQRTFAESVAVLRASRSIPERRRLEQLGYSLYWHGMSLQAETQWEEAAGYYRKAHEVRRKLPRSTDVDRQLAWSAYDLGGCLMKLGRYAEAAEPLWEAVALRRGVREEAETEATAERAETEGRAKAEQPETEPDNVRDSRADLADALLRLAACYADAGRPAAERVLLRRAGPLLLRPGGPVDPTALGNWAFQLGESVVSFRPAEGRRLLAQAVSIQRRAVAERPSPEEYAVLRHRAERLADALLLAGRYRGAARSAELALEAARHETEPTPTAAALICLAQARARTARSAAEYAEARDLARRAVARTRRGVAAGTEGVPYLSHVLHLQAEVLLACARHSDPRAAAQALAPAQEAVTLLQRSPHEQALRNAVGVLARVLERLGRPDDASAVRAGHSPLVTHRRNG